MSPIPQADPRAGYLSRKDSIDAAIARVLDSGRYILAGETAAFEEEFAAYLGARCAVGVASGTDALRLALRACGVGPGDVVITVSHTAVATAAAIEACGAEPLFVDVDPEQFTMDPGDFERTVRSSRRQAVKAVVPVHLYGQMADMTAICEVARRYGLRVVEDCAQAHGAVLEGKKAGTFGDAAAFSFYPTKNLGALGDGGAVVTEDSAVEREVRLLREYGWQERYVSVVPGGNSRLDEIQAAVLRAKLPHLDGDNGARRALAALYDSRLRGGGVDLPATAPGCGHVYHQYVIRTAGRDALRARLRDMGIGTIVHYPVPVHLQPAYKGRRTGPGGLPNTESLAARILSLPMFPELSPDAAGTVASRVLQARADGDG